MRRVVGYIRVSSEGQATEGVSLDAQRVKLAAYCTAMDLELVGIEADEGVSAKTLRRPGLQRALGLLDAGTVDGLLVTKLDRLTRSVRDLGDLVERYFTGDRCSLLSVGDSIDTKTAAGPLAGRLPLPLGNADQHVQHQPTRDALVEVRRQGGVLGADALGWRRIEETDAAGRQCIVRDDAEAETVARITALRGEGLSLRGIATVLTSEGRATKRGGRWAAETVAKVLERAAA